MSRTRFLIASAILFSVSGTLLLPSIHATPAFAASPSILNTFGPVANREAGIFWFILTVAAIIFIVVESMLIYSIIHFRGKAGAAEPKQIHGNNKLEIIWTVIPAVALFIVLGVTISTMVALAEPVNGNILEVNVIAHQWWWEFDYPSYHMVTADSLHVPVNTTVQVNLYSDNVIHSFWVPALSGKMDVIPGHTNVMWFNANTAGTYRGECAEYCGTQHAHMDFNVISESSDTFLSWVSAQQQLAATPTDGTLAAQGAQYFAQGACMGCHGIVGVNLKSYDDPAARNLIGPNLTHFGSRTLIAGGVLDNNPANLSLWLQNPQAIKPGNDMPDLGLSPDKVQALVAYLESLK